MKRMASYRLETLLEKHELRLLVPVSGGVSSITLLYLLEARLRKPQPNRASRSDIQIEVVLIDTTSSVEATIPVAKLIESLRGRFPRYAYSVIAIEDIFNGRAFSLSSDNQENASPTGEQNPGPGRLTSFLSSLPSATSRADVLGILKTRLLARIAKERQCHGILWADTATRLAERTLAETAKGRGFAIPWLISDGRSPFGVDFYYPLRELLRTELVSFAAMLEPPLAPLICDQATEKVVSSSSKTTSLDALMTQYLSSVEEGYPNIVANVVRTSGKLQRPSESPEGDTCSLCGMFASDELGTMEMASQEHRDMYDEPLRLLSDGEEVRLCHGCRGALSVSS